MKIQFSTMKKYNISISLVIIMATTGFGQVISAYEDFENMNVQLGTPIYQSPNDVGIQSQFIELENNYTEEFDSWTGFALSAEQDTMTPGFLNQYSCIVGAGAEESLTYAVAYAPSTISLKVLDPENVFMETLTVSNSTYAYLSMRDGDSFAKKFGGITGNDPDYFLLTIKAYLKGDFVDSMEVYLADYRFDDGSQDYILDSWMTIDVPHCDSMTFSLTSSDNGQFGMNTPAYFTIDNIGINFYVSSEDINPNSPYTLFPNPVNDVLYLNGGEGNAATLEILDVFGRRVRKHNADENIDVSHLPQGTYVLQIQSDGMTYRHMFIKE